MNYPLAFTKICGESMWCGSAWTVKDEDELAMMIARVAIGQATVVERILKETGCAAIQLGAASGRQGAHNLLHVESGTSQAHRDGWMFQVISWIASHLQANSASDRVLIRPPQMIHADKGQDGLLIECSGDDIARIVICEDKATEDPRRQFRTKVLPDLEHYETGERDNELIAGVTSLLSQHGVDDADAIVENILWKEKRAYRVAVTVGDRQASRPAALFEGYATYVKGNVLRRRVELMPLADLRIWMDKLAKKALRALDVIEQHHV